MLGVLEDLDCSCNRLSSFHALNIMVEGEGVEVGDVRLQSYGNWGFDIGNYFNEYSRFDCYGELYPNEKHCHSFCVVHLGKGAALGEVDRLLLEGEVFSLASHLF